MVKDNNNVTNAIGGYFEIANFGDGLFPYQDGILLNTGRNALEYILRIVGNISKIYIPYYTCDAVLEPIRKLNIPWANYRINASLEIDEDITLQRGEYIIANNYFGIKDAYIKELALQYGESLIVDNAQGFFAKPIPKIKTFYSPRKFVGVADGGVAYLDGEVSRNQIVAFDGYDNTIEHEEHLYIRKNKGAESGYLAFQNNERKLGGQPIRHMSMKTNYILNHIDYEKIRIVRRDNYSYLQEALQDINQLILPQLESFECPMIYPFASMNKINLRNLLISKKVFIATYWPNIHANNYFQFEAKLTDQLLALPCDQRYDKDIMQRIIDIIVK